jgi:hypothetical protein
VIAGAGAAALGATLGGAVPALLAGTAGAALAHALDRHAGRRYLGRRRVLATPFPEAWRAFLLERYDHYERLPAPLQARFEDDLRVFLHEARITGVGVQADDELRLLVGASAVTLSVGWPDYEWQQLTEVLLYPDDFDRDYGFEREELAGQTHAWGTVILSAPALRESFDDPDDAFHVGIHEFAHLLDVDQAHFDGILPGLDARRSREWLALVEREMERLRRGKSVLDPYGAEEPAEFMAVAVEAFFEAPLALRRRHTEMYELLTDYFRQDPAAWDDARGLTLR